MEVNQDKGKARLEEITEDTTSTLPTTIEMTPNDVIVLFNTLGVCAKRGAFSVEEFKDIGALHDRLKTYLAPFIEQQQAASEAAKAEASSAIGANNSTTTLE